MPKAVKNRGLSDAERNAIRQRTFNNLATFVFDFLDCRDENSIRLGSSCSIDIVQHGEPNQFHGVVRFRESDMFHERLDALMKLVNTYDGKLHLRDGKLEVYLGRADG